MKFRKIIVRALCAFLMLISASAAFGEGIIVVHPDNPVSSLSSEELKSFLVGQGRFWPDGSAVDLALPSGNELESWVLGTFAGMDPARFKTHWRRLIFSGRAKNFTEISSDAEMRAYISKNPRAIGFVSLGAADASVKIIEVKN